MLSCLVPLALAWGATGCSATAPATLAATPQARMVTVSGRLGQPRQLHLVTPPVAADITGFKLYITRGSNNEALLGELPGTARTITIADLAPNTGYKVRIEAFKGNERIDAADARCETSFNTGTDAQLTGVTFYLKLKDVEGAL